MAPLRMTLTAQLVLRALLADPGREVYGREVMQGAGLASGTVYPILARFEAEGWVSVREETIDKRAEGRPARRYYKLTPEGAEKAEAAVARGATRLAALDAPQEPAKAPPLSIGGIEIGVTVDPRQPPGTVSLVSAGTDRDGKPAVGVAHMVNVGADEPEPGRNQCPSVRPGPPPADGEYRCELGNGHAGAHCFAGSRWGDEDAASGQTRKPRASTGQCGHRIPPGSYCARCGRLI